MRGTTASNEISGNAVRTVFRRDEANGRAFDLDVLLRSILEELSDFGNVSIGSRLPE